jgi:hypothetical protein
VTVYAELQIPSLDRGQFTPISKIEAKRRDRDIVMSHGTKIRPRLGDTIGFIAANPVVSPLTRILVLV